MIKSTLFNKKSIIELCIINISKIKFLQQEIMKQFDLKINQNQIKKFLTFLSIITIQHSDLIKLDKIKNCKILINILITDNKEMQQLNRDFRQKDYPADVISFQTTDNILCVTYDAQLQSIILGDIAINYEHIFKNELVYHNNINNDEEIKQNYKISQLENFTHLFIHSLLHLLGYDHEIDEEHLAEMEIIENKIMEHLGYIKPYQHI